MASNVLLQVLFMVPRSPTQCSLKNLAFSAVVPRRPAPGGLVSRVSTRSCGYSFLERGRNCSFVVRAEDNAEGEVEVEESVESVEAEVSSDEKPSRPPRVKLGDVIGILNKRAVEASDRERPIPDLRPGHVVEIRLFNPEKRKRVSIYKGIIISRQNAGAHSTIRIRRIIAGCGVEIVFPIYSPKVKGIKILNRRKVRRAKLYYLRYKLPRLSTIR